MANRIRSGLAGGIVEPAQGEVLTAGLQVERQGVDGANRSSPVAHVAGSGQSQHHLDARETIFLRRAPTE